MTQRNQDCPGLVDGIEKNGASKPVCEDPRATASSFRSQRSCRAVSNTLSAALVGTAGRSARASDRSRKPLHRSEHCAYFRTSLAARGQAGSKPVQRSARHRATTRSRHGGRVIGMLCGERRGSDAPGPIAGRTGRAGRIANPLMALNLLCLGSASPRRGFVPMLGAHAFTTPCDPGRERWDINRESQCR
jgi:hypothetical protein